MARKVVVAIKDNEVTVATTLTKLCKLIDELNYGYLKDIKLPYNYKGYKIEKHLI